jgi:cytochrome c-type biogenesis protein
VLGAVTVVLGLAFLGWFGFLQRDVRVHRVPAVGIAAAPLLGVLFGLGWTPCIGPTLGAVLTLALNEGGVGRGAVLAVVYSLGLGIPFVLAALAFRRMLGAVGWIRRHQVWVMRLGGAMLVAVGVLLLTGVWDSLTADLRGWVSDFVPVV